MAAELFDPTRGEAREDTIYELGEDSLPTSRTDVTSGNHIGGGWWRLRDPT